MKCIGPVPLKVVAGGVSGLVSSAGGALLVDTARRSGLTQQLSARLGPWRRPLAIHDPGKTSAISRSQVARNAWSSRWP